MNARLTAVSRVAGSVEDYLSRKVMPREGADALVRQFSLLFSITAADCGDEEIATFDRIFARLIEEAATDTRGFLSTQLSTMANAPATTVRRLARDVIEVARPILVHSPVLGDDDLVEILLEAGLAHMAAVAERAELSVVVTDVLVGRGDDTVRRMVAANHGAQLSTNGYKRLSLQAREDMRLEETLIGREDVPAIVIRFLVRHGPGKAREASRTRGAGFGFPAAGAVREPGPVRPVESWYAIYDFPTAEARVGTYAEQGLRGEPLLLRMVAEERFPECVILLARLAGLPPHEIVGHMTSRDPSAFLVAAKAIPLQVRTVFGMLKIGPWCHLLDGGARQAALRRYRTMTKEAARQLLAARGPGRSLP